MASAYYGIGIPTTFKHLIAAARNNKETTSNLFEMLHKEECFVPRNATGKDLVFPMCFFASFLETLGIEHREYGQITHEEYLHERQVKYIEIIDTLLDKLEEYLIGLNLLNEGIIFAYKQLHTVDGETTCIPFNYYDLPYDEFVLDIEQMAKSINLKDYQIEHILVLQRWY